VNGIIVLEGADATGKTTLARHLVERYGARYLHSTARRGVWRWHVGALRLAIRAAESQLVVLDRHWLSEQVYGQVFRGAPAYDLGARCLDRVLLKHGAVTVLCVRHDLGRHLDHFDRLKTERPEKFPSVVRAAQLYLDLARGNLAHAGQTYVDQLVRFGDFATRHDVMLYDMDRHPGARGITSYARGVLSRLASVRGAQYQPALARSHPNVLGHLGVAKVLVVGEAISPAHPTPLPPWPFFSDDAPMSSAVWLNQALHRSAIDETRLAWVNAVSPDDQLPRLLTRQLGIITLGKVAAKRVADLTDTPFSALSHPQHARRFHHGQFQAYADALLGAVRLEAARSQGEFS
jgi:hypothetical protein